MIELEEIIHSAILTVKKLNVYAEEKKFEKTERKHMFLFWY